MKILFASLILVLAGCAPGLPAPVPTPSPTAPLAAAPAAAVNSDVFEQNQITLQAPSCAAGLTPGQTEGPFYKANTPAQNVLWQPGMDGKKLFVVGYVLGPNCSPLAGAWLDFWQANASGNYDNQGYTLRGHQFTHSQGRHFLVTILPGEYPGRTEHIHVKIRPSAGATLTA